MPIPVSSSAPATDLVLLDEVKDFLNITSTNNDTELGSFITAASQLWVNRVGVGNQVTQDEWYDGGHSAIALRHTPVASVQKVSESYGSTITYALSEEVLDGGSSFDAYGYTIDLTTGTLVRRANGVSVPFAQGRRNVHVVYTSGYAEVPADIKHGVLLLVRHMWQTQRSGIASPGMGGDDYNPGTTFTWPNRVQEIAQAYMVPGIA